MSDQILRYATYLTPEIIEFGPDVKLERMKLVQAWSGVQYLLDGTMAWLYFRIILIFDMLVNDNA